MIPLSVFLLAIAAVYLGSIESAFGALMRLSLRLGAEGTNRPGTLGTYLADPLLLFLPTPPLLSLLLSLAAFVLGFEWVLPLVIVGRDPERVLDLLLPTFAPVARALNPA